MQKNLLKASEAKKLAMTSDCQLNRVAKEIEEAAKENRHCIIWCMYDTDITVKEKVCKTLVEAGYDVKVAFKGTDGLTDNYKTFADPNITDILISW